MPRAMSAASTLRTASTRERASTRRVPARARALPSSSSPRRRRLSITTSPGVRLDAASPRAPTRARAASDVVESSSAPLDPIGLNPDRAAVVNADPDAYSWTKQWYPVAVVDVLDETKPHPTTLLGIDLVVWKNGDGSWSVFEDKCPHRLAPLSEGRVESDGTLLCAYHAWRFDGDGKCTSMPQASSAEEEERIKANVRSCAFKRPSMVAQGLVWAWGEGGKDAEMEAAMTPPLFVPEIEGIGKSGRASCGGFRNHWQVRDLPYGWNAFFENAIDPAHAVVSHHTLVGSRYDDPAGFQCVVERPVTDAGGFRCAIDPAVPPFNSIGKYDAETSYDFQPPALLKIDWRHEGGRFLTSHYCVPTRPGWCRHFVVTIAQRRPEMGNKIREHRWFKLNLFTLTSPAWLTHVLGPTFLHQDMVLLHQQEKIIAQGDGQAMAQKWKDQVFTPSTADKMTIFFYKWFEKNGPIPWAPGTEQMPPIERDSSKLFDTYEMHTKYCTHCQGALRNTEIGMWATGAIAGAKLFWVGASVVFTAALLGSGDDASSSLDVFELASAVDGSVYGDFFSALSLGATSFFLWGFAQMFRTYPFSHSEDDIVMEGTAKIGLSNDGPSAYIDFVDSTLFKEKGGDHNRGCECSTCSPHFKDLIKSTMLARAKKSPAVVEEAEEERSIPVAR
jgi:phenylpropionate dioxygenase-like ring-hydroxylating dioxygenase large terminal subunit